LGQDAERYCFFGNTALYGGVKTVTWDQKP